MYWAEQHIPSGLAAVLFATQPLLIAALAHVALPGERLAARATGGLLLGFAGVATLFSADFARLGGASAARAALVMLGSPLVTAIATVAVKRWGAGLHPISLTAVPMLMAAAIMGVAARTFEAGRPLVLDARSVGALVYLAVCGSALTFTVFYWLLARVRATRASLISYTVPVVALVTGAVAFGEPLLPRVLLGTALIVAGVGLVSRTR